MAAAAVLGLGGPSGVAAASPSPAPCEVAPESCATIEVTLTGNGAGSITSGDGFIACHRSGGVTTGSCEHTYDLSGGSLFYGITTAPEPGSLLCDSIGNCVPVGVAGGGELKPGDHPTFTAEFRLLETEAPPSEAPSSTPESTPSSTPSATPRPTPRPTKTPRPTPAPTAAPTVEPSPTAAGPAPSAPPTASTQPTSAALPSPAATAAPTTQSAGTDIGPPVLVLLGVLVFGIVAFAGLFFVRRGRTQG